jgi:prephenate dehydrogenase
MTDRPVVAVLGLGLVGASLALALRRSGQVRTVIGWDPDFDTARLAQKHGVADRFARGAADAVRDAAVVFVATRSDEFRDTLATIAPHLKAGTTVCSVVELHEPMGQVAERVLPSSVSFICGHPILGETVDADTMPSADVLRGAAFCVTPLPSAHPDAVAFVTHLAEALGMGVFFVDAREHDAFSTGVELLPSVLAAALLRVAVHDPSWRELGRLAGGEFRHATALADSDPARRQAALAAGREHAVRWLDATIAELTRLRDGLRGGQEPGDFFAGAFEARRKWLADRRVPRDVAEDPAAQALPPRRRLWF